MCGRKRVRKFVLIRVYIVFFMLLVISYLVWFVLVFIFHFIKGDSVNLGYYHWISTVFLRNSLTH